MTEHEQEALALLETFLRAHYHEVRWVIEGTTEVLNLWPSSSPYRMELSRAFRVLDTAPLPAGTLARLVQYEANRLVHDDEEARQFLNGLYTDLHLDWEAEEEALEDDET